VAFVIVQFGNGLTPCSFPRREDVDRSNSTRLNRLLGEEEMPYRAIDGGTADPQQREKLLSNFMAPQLLVLRVGAQVIPFFHPTTALSDPFAGHADQEPRRNAGQRLHGTCRTIL
jgi:hypothetical protein